MSDDIDIRLAAALIIAAVLTVVVAVSGFFVSGLIAPGYQFTFSDGMAISLFVAGVFAVLLGFSYWFVGYVWETKQIWNPDKISPIKPHYTKSHDYTDELEPRQQKAKVGDTLSRESLQCVPKMEYRTPNIEDFGLRHFNNNDDWINMKPGKRE
jgi:flagellar basal body-associated protein FliL